MPTQVAADFLDLTKATRFTIIELQTTTIVLAWTIGFFIMVTIGLFRVESEPSKVTPHLYKGRFTNTSDILYTFDGKHLYRGRFTNTSDILLTFGAPVPVIIMLLNTL